MISRLERYGVKFEKDEYGEYAVRRVHRSGSYVLPMPEGKDVKKVLYRVLRRKEMREKISIENRLMPVRVLTDPDDGGRAIGAVALHTRTGEFYVVGAKSVILATGPCGRLGLPASGYLYGTYENPTNAGDGYSMAYHAGAELSGIECFQINPLIKDYNGPACAYVANPFGGYQVNADGDRFVDSDYWSGDMMSEVKHEIESARGPIYLKVSHLPEETVEDLESILHTTERPTRGTFHANRGHDYRTHDIEMHISEIGLCSGHSASGVWVDENGATTVDGLYAAGDLACVPHNYMIGAFVYGELTGQHASERAKHVPAPTALPADQIADAHELIYRPLRNPDGPPQPQVEYKLRRFVNDYVAPPKASTKLGIAIETFERMRGEIAAMGGRTPHELMRCAEVNFIRDCADLAARSSLTRTESRWGLYHQRDDITARDDANWGYHLNIRKNADGEMEFRGRPVAPYLVPVQGLNHLPPQDRSIIDIEQPPTRIGPAGTSCAAETPRPAVASDAEPAVREPLSPRIVELVSMEAPTLDDLAPYLADADATVRRTAVATVTEYTPEGFEAALATALTDADEGVRQVAVDSLRELVEVLAGIVESPVATLAESFVDALRDASSSDDHRVRGGVLDLLRALREGDPLFFAGFLTDAHHRVRIEAIRGLVSLDAAALIAVAADDSNREVRVVAAQGLATVGGGVDTIRRLAVDPDPLVRSAGLAALATLGEPDVDAKLLRKALRDNAWQVRKGAAAGLAVAFGPETITALTPLISDPHGDVRKAAVTTLRPWFAEPGVAELLERARADEDADVRAVAR